MLTVSAIRDAFARAGFDFPDLPALKRTAYAARALGATASRRAQIELLGDAQQIRKAVLVAAMPPENLAAAALHGRFFALVLAALFGPRAPQGWLTNEMAGLGRARHTKEQSADAETRVGGWRVRLTFNARTNMLRLVCDEVPS